MDSQPKYPQRLIPDQSYRIIPEEDLANQSGLVLIRHVEGETAKFINNTSILNPECIVIQSDHLKDLSTNLLGVFKTEDVSFGIHKDFHSLYTCLWDGEAKCDLPQDSHYFHDGRRGWYFLEVDKFVNKVIPYSTPDNGTEEYHFNILHTPTKCNYWHISVRCYDCNETEIDETDLTKGKKKRVWRMLKNYL